MQSASVLQPVGHAGLDPVQTKGAHDGLPADPRAAVVQDPVAQVSQASQVLSQQTPPTQYPLAHSKKVSLAHAAPLALVPRQRPAMQLPLVHSRPRSHVAPFASLATHAGADRGPDFIPTSPSSIGTSSPLAAPTRRS